MIMGRFYAAKENNHKCNSQGGINKDETAISAAKREMFEEVGLNFNQQ